MNEPPVVSIVIAAFNAERTLPSLLAACAGQDLAVPHEVIVVDDGSLDATARIAEGAGVRVVRQPNRGPAAARNAGWKHARAHTILFTDSDCVPRRDWARVLSGAIDDAHPVACGSYGIANPKSLLARAIHAEIVWRHSRLPGEVDFAGSYNLGAALSALESVGGFDESYAAPSGEDNDLSYRWHSRGVRIRFVPDAIVDHHHPESFAHYLREQARHGRWRVALYATHPSRVGGDAYAGAGDLVAPPLALVGVAAAAAAPFVSVAAPIALACLAFVVLFHVQLAVRVFTHTREPAALLLLPVGVLRALARGMGILQGLGDLIIRRRG